MGVRLGSISDDGRQHRIDRPLSHRAAIEGDVVLAKQSEEEAVHAGRDATAAIGDDAFLVEGADGSEQLANRVGGAEGRGIEVLGGQERDIDAALRGAEVVRGELFELSEEIVSRRAGVSPVRKGCGSVADSMLERDKLCQGVRESFDRRLPRARYLFFESERTALSKWEGVRGEPT